MPSKRIEGKRAIVTGASSGIGAAIAKRFAAEGASVWTAGGSNAEGLKATLDACTAEGVNAGGKCYDLSDSNNAAAVIREGGDFLGGLDIFVSCAGARNHKPMTDFSADDVDFLFEVNAKSPFRASIEAAKIMKAQKSGRILIIGSIHAMIGIENNALYCTTKAANHNMTRALATELGPHGIRVNCLAPGTTETDRVKKIHDSRPGYADSKLVNISVKRFASSEEMAGIAIFLVSDENDFMNGAIVTSDGGATAV
ncbi:MAG TPA: SDR family oxidoreductase [Nitrospinota bacterium]|jgi:NAD(P)-dependent dehydrogenase (short-subunit alcohol dehydrogenase family)|nr:SDR family oxidoreductase [Nitrospinota bacterium]HJP14892.1 SDR family oxidoreductase [Nitrospinota bacterium]